MGRWTYFSTCITIVCQSTVLPLFRKTPPLLPLANSLQLSAVLPAMPTSASGDSFPAHGHEHSTGTATLTTTLMYENDDSSVYEHFNRLSNMDDEASNTSRINPGVVYE